MSFIMPSQRGFDHSQQDQQAPLPIHNQNDKMNVPSSTYAQYNSTSSSTYPSVPLSGHATNAPPPPHPEHTSQNLPKVGQTRCYWVLLSAQMHFIYMDPVLQSHLGEQAEQLIGKSLISFVHPEEQASAKQDLGSATESRTLHGSVTRVRFSRLSRVRRQLGYQGPPPAWADAPKIAVDENYMAVDLVINWAAEGLVLCFIHAAVDLTPHDNDESKKTPWTNWCGTPSMGMDQIQILFQRLIMCIPQGDLTRVFQILSNQPGRQLLLSWPPDDEHRPGPTGRDFARLVEDVQMGTSSATDAKTSCTRRYKAEQNLPGVGPVESIFIPHGTIIFACHKASFPPSRGPGSTMPNLGYGASNYSGGPSSSQQYYEQQQHSPYVLPPLPSSPSYNAYPPSHPHYPQGWSSSGETQQAPHHYSHWHSQGSGHSLPTSVSNMRSGSYQSQQWSSSSSSSYLEPPSGLQHTFSRSMSPQYGAYPPGGEPPPSPDVVPPPRRRVSPGAAREQYIPGGRGASNRPGGILRCASCKTTSSPEWRKGPSGKKELCNACGLRYARSRAKKEGHNMSAQRRRKDRGGLTKHGSATPPASSGLRRYEGSPLMSTSDAGSGSGTGSPVFSSHHAFEGFTPSPSPPAGNMSFVHYNHSHHHPQSGGPHHGEQRQTYAGSSSSFYSVPSPLSNAPVLSVGSSHNNDGHGPGPSSRLEPGPGSQYSDRMHSPLISQSPTLSPASFERDRDRDRERDAPPPTAADPRSSSVRSILLAD